MFSYRTTLLLLCAAPLGCSDASPAPSSSKVETEAPANTEAVPTPTPNLLANGAFESVDDGVPTDWTCLNAKTNAKQPCHFTATGRTGNALELEPNEFAYQFVTTSEGDALELEAYQAGSPLTLQGTGGSAYVLGPPDDDHPMVFVTASEGASGVVATAYSKVHTAAPAILRRANGMVVLNNTGPATARFDDVALRRVGTNRRELVILSADAAERLHLDGSVTSELWVPLPMDYAAHVPLSLALTLDHPELVESIRYEEDDVHNFGAYVRFKSAGAKSSPIVEMRWHTESLSLEVSAAERIALYGSTESPAEWTGASDFAQVNDPVVATVAATLAPTSATSLEKVRSVLDWTSANAGSGTGNFTGLDAKSVIQSHLASCTGFTNAAVALGRSIGVPTRHLSNILVGEPQQMHSINEFFVSETSSYRRAEPQGKDVVVREARYLPIRILRKADEVNTPGMFPGVPRREFPSLSGGKSYSEPLFNCTDLSLGNVCNHKAIARVSLADDAKKTRKIFDRARAAWRLDVAALTSKGVLGAGRESARKTAAAATSLADLDTLLRALEAL